jgi:hypothetical protein
MSHQAPGHDGLFRLLVTLRVVSALGLPVAVIAVGRRLFRRFAWPPLLRLTVHALIMVVALQAPKPPLKPEQAWHDRRDRLQAMADAALRLKDADSFEDGPWRARHWDNEVVITLQGFERFPLVYSPHKGHDFLQGPAEAVNRQLIKDLDHGWYVVSESKAW